MLAWPGKMLSKEKGKREEKFQWLRKNKQEILKVRMKRLNMIKKTTGCCLQIGRKKKIVRLEKIFKGGFCGRGTISILKATSTWGKYFIFAVK